MSIAVITTSESKLLFLLMVSTLSPSVGLADEIAPGRRDRQSFTVRVEGKLTLSEATEDSVAPTASGMPAITSELRLDTAGLLVVSMATSSQAQPSRHAYVVVPGRTTIRIHSAETRLITSSSTSKRLLHFEIPTSDIAVLTIAEP